MRFREVCLLIGFLLSVSSLAAADVTDLQCEQTGPAEYRLSYAFTQDTHTVQILASADAAGERGLAEIETTGETSVTIHTGTPGQRVYFFLQPDHGHRREVSC
jgi:protein-tyrosine phosphatase